VELTVTREGGGQFRITPSGSDPRLAVLERQATADERIAAAIEALAAGARPSVSDEDGEAIVEAVEALGNVALALRDELETQARVHQVELAKIRKALIAEEQWRSVVETRLAKWFAQRFPDLVPQVAVGFDWRGNHAVRLTLADRFGDPLPTALLAKHNGAGGFGVTVARR